MKKQVCRNCTRRMPGCHDSCEDFQHEKAERDAMRERIRQQKQLDAGLTAIEIERGERAARRYK